MELSQAQTEDPFKRQMATRVVACDEAEDGRFAVRLDETLFYPEGGGQPADHGRIDGAEVRDVQRDEDGRIIHLVDRSISAGEVDVSVDWDRRFDHMQQHTAQHLITAIAADEFGMETVSFHLGEEYSSIDLDVVSISRPKLRRMEARVNEEIRRARPVRFRFVTRREYDEMEVRSRGLPDDHEGRVRIIEIDDIDRNTCGGTHVTNTAQLQMVALIGTEHTRDRVRLSYLAGGRLLDRMQGCLRREERFNELLSCGRDEHVEAVERTIDEAQEASNRVTSYQEELAERLGDQLYQSGERVLALHREETDFQFLNAIQRAATSEDDERVVFLTGAPPGGVEEGIFVLSGPEALVDEVGDEVAELLDGRGGGPPGRYQGKASSISQRDEVVQLLERRVTEPG